jgi:hypothetical protein
MSGVFTLFRGSECLRLLYFASYLGMEVAAKFVHSFNIDPSTHDFRSVPINRRRCRPTARLKGAYKRHRESPTACSVFSNAEGTVSSNSRILVYLLRCGRAHGSLSSSPDRAHASHVYLDHPFEALVIGIDVKE